MKLKISIGCLSALIALSSYGVEKVSVKFYTPEIVRVIKYPDGKEGADRESLVVIGKPENVKVAVSGNGNETSYK